MITAPYYYIIVGGGLAGLQLAIRFQKDIFFKGKKIAIIDPSPKNENDKSWCFWEEGKSHWDSLTFKEWETGKFISPRLEKELFLKPYSYKMIRSIDFYNWAHKTLKKSRDIIFIEDEISEIDAVTMQAKGRKATYGATHFFDSRVNPQYLEKNNYTTIFQHFKGWKIKTKKPCFQPSSFTMMDYRLTYEQSTSFTYVLPFSESEALVEFTFFTPFLTEEKVYNQFLKEYISKILKIEDFTVTETENGVIPMTDFPFANENSSKMTKIGTGGGWVKASTGYSFKNTEKNVAKIISNLKSGLDPGKNLIRKKFKKYDAIFLDVLDKHNEDGPQLFEKFYTKNSIQSIFKFLDEETGFLEDIPILFSLFGKEFIQSYFRKI